MCVCVCTCLVCMQGVVCECLCGVGYVNQVVYGVANGFHTAS